MVVDLFADICDHICALLPEGEGPSDGFRGSAAVVAQGDEERGSSSSSSSRRRAAERGRSVLELTVRAMSRASCLRNSACTVSACEVVADLLPLYEESELYNRAIGVRIAASCESTLDEDADAQARDGAHTNRGTPGPSCAARVCEAVRLWKGFLRDAADGGDGCHESASPLAHDVRNAAPLPVAHHGSGADADAPDDMSALQVNKGGVVIVGVSRP